VQEPAPDTEYLPATQGMQLTSPEASVMVYVPAGQEVQVEKGDTEMVPVAQAVQTDAAAAE